MANQQPHVFISHADKDRDIASRLKDDLERAGFRSWVAWEDIGPGEHWTTAIQKAVDDCGAMTVVMSENARDSEFVANETIYAIQQRKPVFIARTDGASLPIYLVTRQATDFRGRHDRAVQTLLRALRRISLTEPLPEPSRRQQRQRLAPEPNETNFFRYLQQLPGGTENAELARELHTWARSKTDQVIFGGLKIPGFRARLALDGQKVTVFSVRAYSRHPAVEIPFQYLRHRPPFDAKDQRLAAVRDLNQLLPEENRISDDRADGRPSLPMSAVNEALRRFQTIMQQTIDNLRSAAQQ